MKKACCGTLAYMSPLQKPVAKLLKSSSAGGRGQSAFDSIAAAITTTRVKLDATDPANTRANPGLSPEKPDIISPESRSMLSARRPVLKNSPENRPVRNINMNISPIFFICMSPFSSITEYAEGRAIMTWKKEEKVEG